MCGLYAVFFVTIKCSTGVAFGRCEDVFCDWLTEMNLGCTTNLDTGDERKILLVAIDACRD